MNEKTFFLLTVLFPFVVCCSYKEKESNTKSTGLKSKPRVVVSTDIGGTDPDDNQSMIHFLMYADKFQTEGLISSPYGEGRKSEILRMIDMYEKDYTKLKAHGDFPEADELRKVTKQGALVANLANGWGEPTEGSDWIIQKAKEDNEDPLWILVWGGLEDVAQALHDAPEIAAKIRVYWIGGPNKKWSVHSYLYIARNFPDLWMIEANSTYRGWFDDRNSKGEMENDLFYDNFMKGMGVLGTDFIHYYKGSIKMGDTPSLAYLLNGDPSDPTGESWGGSFTRLPYSSFRVFTSNTSQSDTVPVYGVIEFEFRSDAPETNDSPEIWMKIDGQRIDGFYEGSGVYKVRFVPKRIGNWDYVINCEDEGIDGQAGKFVSVNPWPGKENENNFTLNNWWSDRSDPDLYLGEYQGAKTVSKWREEYLTDWVERLSWLKEL